MSRVGLDQRPRGKEAARKSGALIQAWRVRAGTRVEAGGILFACHILRFYVIVLQ